ncbi:MAG: tetratricopeptide repeat protein, partial [Chitinophagales bacterium]
EATSGLKKADRARLYYILGQLANEQGNYDEAVTAFQRVTKSKPLYDMEFNARLNIAKTKLLSGDYSNQQAIAYLEKMVKDGKNIDYQDQIYFAMAEVAIASGDMDMATEYLAQSAANSTANPEQKALSFLKLAEISYSVGDFIQAAGYYDSTLTSLPKNYKGYDEIVDRKEVLTELATHAQTVTLEDSLQNLAKMTAGKRTVYIEEIIAQLEAEAQKLRLEKEEAFLQDPNANKKDKKQSGDWYFYNPTAKALGFSEFQSRWGSRPLTDDWRLNSKISGTSGGGSDLAEENGAAEGALAAGESISRDELLNRADQGTLTVQDFLKDLPLTAEKMMTSDQKVISALYQMAMIYRTRLESEDKAETIFKDILQRYPKNAEYGPQVNYNLYLMADKANDSALRTRYRNAILQQFPESLFAKILEDESYINKANEADEELWAYYEQTYDLYKGGDFDQVQARFQELNTKFERNPLQAKFDLLGALVIGETQDKNAYITALKAVIKAHNKGEERDKAKEILDYIEGKSKKGKSSDSKYTYDPNKKHYIVVALDQYTKNISKITNQFSDFNNGNFSAEKLKTNQMLLDPKHQIILVKDFKNATAAMNYYKALEKNEVSVMKGLQTGYKFFAISKSNFTQYFKEKDPTSYIEFFEENYK